MIVWNSLGHTVLGFEQSWATPVTAIFTAIAVSMFLEWIDARATNRELRFKGSLGNFLNFLPACLIPGFACGMLLFANERLGPLIFAWFFPSARNHFAPVRTAIPSIYLTHPTASPATLFCFLTSASRPHHSLKVSPAWDWGIPLIVLSQASWSCAIHGAFASGWRLGLLASCSRRRSREIFGTFFRSMMPMTFRIIFTLYANLPHASNGGGLFGCLAAAGPTVTSWCLGYSSL
jgi:hypothetical protein